MVSGTDQNRRATAAFALGAGDGGKGDAALRATDEDAMGQLQQQSAHVNRLRRLLFDDLQVVNPVDAQG